MLNELTRHKMELEIEERYFQPPVLVRNRIESINHAKQPGGSERDFPLGRGACSHVVCKILSYHVKAGQLQRL